MSYQGSAIFRSVPLSLGSSPEKCLEADPSRKYLAIQNNSSGPIYVGFDVAPDSSDSFMIASGVSWLPPIAPKNAIYLLGGSPGVTVMVVG